MATARNYRIRVRGRQRDDIDLDLLVQALLMIGEQRCREREQEAADGRNDASSGNTQESAA
jgi:hypothetical protein